MQIFIFPELPIGPYFHLMYEECQKNLTVENGDFYYCTKNSKKKVQGKMIILYNSTDLKNHKLLFTGILYVKIVLKPKNDCHNIPFLPHKLNDGKSYVGM